MKINKERLLTNLHRLREFTDTPGNGVTRFSYGKQDARARAYLLRRAAAAGCTISIDPLQNIRIGLAGNRPGRKTVLAGSHIDTVRNGGWLDGIYGVCGALEVLETLAENAESTGHPEDTKNAGTCGQSETSASCNYEMVIFAEEEGSNFGSTMTGSKFATGLYTEKDLDRLRRDDGQTLRQVLQHLAAGADTGTTEADPKGNLITAEGKANVAEDAVSSGASGSDTLKIYSTDPVTTQHLPWTFDNIKTMLELHIEQGPVLDREGLSLGIVDAIFGMRVIEATLTGVGNHAGATPMTERYDALCAAAECILKAERLVKSDPDQRTVVTAGKLELWPNCSNVIPESVKFTLEIRDKDDEKINDFMDRIILCIQETAQTRGVNCQIREHSSSQPLQLSDRLIRSMKERAEKQQLACKVMDSGAVHDACMVAPFADTGMIFVPSIGGRSHVPEEDTRKQDLIAGVQFLLDTVLEELK